MRYDYLRRFSRGASRLPLKSWQTGCRHDNHQRVPHTTENAENSFGETASFRNTPRYPSGSQGHRSTDPPHTESNGPWPPKTQNAFYPHEKNFYANPDAEHRAKENMRKDHPTDSSRCYPGSNVEAPHWIQHPRPSLPAMINIPRAPDPHPGGSTVIYAGPGSSEPHIQTASKKASDSLISFVDGSYKIVESGKIEKGEFNQLKHRVYECESCGSIKIGTIEASDAIHTQQPGRTLGGEHAVPAKDPKTISSGIKPDLNPEEYVPDSEVRTELIETLEVQEQSQKSSAEKSITIGEFQKVSELKTEPVQQAPFSQDSPDGGNRAVNKPTVGSGQAAHKTGYLQAECVPFQADRQLNLAHAFNSTSQEVQAPRSGLNGCETATELGAQSVQQVSCWTFSNCPEQLQKTDQVLRVPSYAVPPKSNAREVLQTSANSDPIQRTQQRKVGAEVEPSSCQSTGDQKQYYLKLAEMEESTDEVKTDRNEPLQSDRPPTDCDPALLQDNSEATLKIRHRGSFEAPQQKSVQVLESSLNLPENHFEYRNLSDEIYSLQEKTVKDYEAMLRNLFCSKNFLNNQQMITEDFSKVEKLMSKILAMKEKLTQQNEEITKSLVREISSIKVELTQEIVALRAKMGQASIAQKQTEGIEQIKKELLNEIATVKNVSFKNLTQLAEKSAKEMRSLNEELTKEISTVTQKAANVLEKPTKEIAALREEIAREIKDQTKENKMMIEKPVKEIMRMNNELLKEIAIVKDKTNQNTKFVEKPATELAAMKDGLIKKMTAIEATIAQNVEASLKPAKYVEKIKEDLMKEMATIKDVLVNNIGTSQQATESAAMERGLMKDITNKEGPVKDIVKVTNERETAVIKENVLQNKETEQRTVQEIATMKGNTAMEGLMNKMAAIDAKVAQNIEESQKPTEYVVKMKEDLMKEMAALKDILVYNNETLQSGMEIAGIKGTLTKKMANRDDENSTTAKVNPLKEIAIMTNELMKEIAVIKKNVLQNSVTAQKPLRDIATMKEAIMKEMAAMKADLIQNSVAANSAKEIGTIKEDLLKEMADMKTSTVETYKMVTEKPGREIEKLEENSVKEIADMKTTTIQNYEMETEIPAREIATMQDKLMKELAAMKANTIESYAMATEKPVYEIATMKNELMKEMAAIKEKILQNNVLVQKPVQEVAALTGDMVNEIASIKADLIQNNNLSQKPVKEIAKMKEDLMNEIASMKSSTIQNLEMAAEKPVKDIATMKSELLREMAALRTSTVENYKLAEVSGRLLASIKDEMKEMALIKDKTTENCALAAGKPVREIATMKTELMNEMASIKDGITKRIMGTQKITTHIEDVEMLGANVGKAAVPRKTVTENTATFTGLVPDVPQVESDLIKELESFKKLTIQNALSAAIRMKEILSVKEQLSSTLINKITNENTFVPKKNVKPVQQLSTRTSEMRHEDQRLPERSQISLETVDSGDRCSLTGHCEIPYHLLRLQKQGFDKSPFPPKSAAGIGEGRDTDQRVEIEKNAQRKNLVHRPTEHGTPSKGRPPFKGAQSSSDTNAKSPTSSSKRPPLCFPPNNSSSYNLYSTNPTSGEIPTGLPLENPRIPTSDLSASSAQIKNEIAAMKADTIETYVMALEYPFEEFSKMGDELVKEMTAIKKLTIENYVMTTGRGKNLDYVSSSASADPLSVNLFIQHGKSDGDYSASKDLQKIVRGTSLDSSSGLTDGEIATMKAITLENYIMGRENGFEEISKWKEDFARETTAMENLEIKNYEIAADKAADNLLEKVASKMEEELATEMGSTGNVTLGNFVMAAEKPKSMDLLYASSLSSNTRVEAKSALGGSAATAPSAKGESSSLESPLPTTMLPRRSSSCLSRSSTCGFLVVQCRPPPPLCCPPPCPTPCPPPCPPCPPLCQPTYKPPCLPACPPPCPPACPSPCSPACPPPCPLACPPPCPPACSPPCPPASPRPCRPTCAPYTCEQAPNNDLIKTLKKGVIPIEESKVRDYFSKGMPTTPTLEIRAAGCPCPPSKPDNTDKLPPENSKRPSSSGNIGDKPFTSSGTSGDKPPPSSDNSGDKPPASSGSRKEKRGEPPGIYPPGFPGSKPPTKSDSPVRMGRSSFSAYNVPPRPETLSVSRVSTASPHQSGSLGVNGASKSSPVGPSSINNPPRSVSLSVRNSPVSPISPGSIGSTQPSSSGSVGDTDHFLTSSSPAGANDFTARSIEPNTDSGSNASHRRPCNPANRPFFVREKPPRRSAFANHGSNEANSNNKGNNCLPLGMGRPQSSNLDNSVTSSLNTSGIDKMKSSDKATSTGNPENQIKYNSRPVRPENPQNVFLSTPDNVISTLNDDGSKTKSLDTTIAWSLELENKDGSRPVKPGSHQGTAPSKLGNATSWDKPGINNLNSTGRDKTDSSNITGTETLEIGNKDNRRSVRPGSLHNTSLSRPDHFANFDISDISVFNKAGTRGPKAAYSVKLAENLETKSEGNTEDERRQSFAETATARDVSPLNAPYSRPDNPTSLNSSGINTQKAVESERPKSSDSFIVAGNLVTASKSFDIKPAEWDEEGIAKVRFNLFEKQGSKPEPEVETSHPSKPHKESLRLSRVDAQQTSNHITDQQAPKPQDMIWRVTYPFNFPKLDGEDPIKNPEVSESKSSSILKQTDDPKANQDLRGSGQRETQAMKSDTASRASTTNSTELEDMASNELNPPEHDSVKLTHSKGSDLPIVSGKDHASSQKGGSSKNSVFTVADIPSVQLATILLLSRAAEISRIRVNKPVSRDLAHKKGKNGQISSRNSASDVAHRRASSPSAPPDNGNSGRPRNTIDITYHEGLTSMHKGDSTGVSPQVQKPWPENSVQRQNEILSKLANLRVEESQSNITSRLASLPQTNFDAAYFLRECALSKPRHSAVLFSKDYIDDNIANTDRHFSRDNKSTDLQQEKLNAAPSSLEQLQTSRLDTNARKLPSTVSGQVLTKQKVAEHNKKITEHERQMSAVREKHLKLQYIKEKNKNEKIQTPVFLWKEQLRSLLPDPKALDKAIAEVLSFDAPRRSPSEKSIANSLGKGFNREIVENLSAEKKSSQLHSDHQGESSVKDDVFAKMLSGEIRSSRPHQSSKANATNTPRKPQQLISLPSIPKCTENTSKSRVKSSIGESKFNTSTAPVPDSSICDENSNNKETKVSPKDKLPRRFKQYRPHFSETYKQEINKRSIESQPKPTKRSSTTLPLQVMQILQSGNVDTQSKGQQSIPPTPKKPQNALHKFKGPTVSSGSLTPEDPPGKSMHTAVSTAGSCVGLDEFAMTCKSHLATQSHALEKSSDQNSPTKKAHSGPPGCPCAENTGSSPPGGSAGSSDGGNSRGGSRRNDGSLPMKVKDGLNKQMATEMTAFLRYFKMMAHFGRVDVAYRGIESFFRKQVEEEREHALEIASWTNLRGGENQMSTIGKENSLRPECLGRSHSAALAEAVSMEVSVTKSLHHCRETSENCSDVMTSKYLTKLFLPEQTESIDEISRLLTNAQRAEASPREIQTFDESLYARYKDD